MMSSSATESYQSPQDPQTGEVVRGPYIVVILNCVRPTETPLRISVARAHRVELRRAHARAVHRDVIEKERVCQLNIADPTMSELHAFIVQDVSGSYRVWDCGSKNGTTLNGRRVEEPTTLADGDLIAVGCTYLLFRSAADCYLHEPFDVEPLDEEMATANPTFARSIVKVGAIAKTALPVLLTGQSGSGRETAARWIHQLSGRPGEFVRLSCAELVEHAASIRLAQGGTLFLDGIDSLDARGLALVSSLLDPNEWGDPSRADQRIDVRVLASGPPGAKAQLPPRTASRIAGYVFEIPSVWERREDLGMYIARALRAAGAGPGTRFERPAARALLTHSWPGNFHELHEAIRHALAFAGGASIDQGHLPAPVVASERRGARRREIVLLFEKHDGNVSAIARELNVSRAQVHRLAEEHTIAIEDYRTS